MLIKEGALMEDFIKNNKKTILASTRRDPKEITETLKQFSASCKIDEEEYKKRNPLWKPLTISEIRKTRRESSKEMLPWSNDRDPWL